MSQERLLSVLRAPHISEKATNNAEKSNTVVLKVALDANKAEIAAAVAQLFEVKVDVTAPKIAKPKVEGNIYKPEITDNLSGVEETFLRYIDKDGKTQWITAKDDGTFEIPEGIDHKNIYIHTFDHAGNIASLNLDGSEYGAPEQQPEDLGANIKPVFRVTNYQDFEGKHIEGSEKLNMFPIEINWRQDVGVNDGKGWKSLSDYNYSNGLVNVAPGSYDFYIAQIPNVYEPLKEQTKTVKVEKGKESEVVFETRQKEEKIPKGFGEVNIRLQINDYSDNYMGPGATYVIKDKDGKEINRDTLKTYTKLYETAVKDKNGKLTGLNFFKDLMTILPVGEYTVEIKTKDDSLKFETTSIKFTVEENKPKKVIFKTQETINDIVNISFEGLAKIKINLYISGDVSEYSSKSGITKCRYFQKKNELVSEFCIDRYYWNSEPMLDTKKKFLLFLESSFINLGILIKEKLKSKGYNFDSEMFKEIALKSLIAL